MSWSSLADKMYKVDGLMESFDTLHPAIAAGLGGALAWFGKPGSDALDNRLPLFWRNTSEFLMITAGFLSAIYGSVEVVNQAVRAETDSSATYVGALFVDYGGESWITDLLGFSEYVWVAIYLALGTFIAGVPLYSSMTFNKMWDASKQGDDAMK